MLKDYIACVGADGTGKTTISKELANLLGAHWTYEPYGKQEKPSDQNQLLSQLRHFVLDKRWDECLNNWGREYLLLASRSVTTDDIKRRRAYSPVVSDRCFIDGMVFSKIASKIFYDVWWNVGKHAIKTFPDIVVYFKSSKQNIVKIENDIYDNEADSFHDAIKNEFDILLEQEKIKQIIPEMALTRVHVFNVDMNRPGYENALILKTQLNV